MVPDLNWALNWDFFGSQEIWSSDFHGVTEFFQDQISRGPKFSGIKFLGDQFLGGPNFFGTKFLGDSIPWGLKMSQGPK